MLAAGPSYSEESGVWSQAAWMMMVQWMGSERRLRGGCGCCPCTRVAVAASERGRGEGGASAVEAGQSCSRHQGRHFLWGDKERDRRKGKKGTKD